MHYFKTHASFMELVAQIPLLPYSAMLQGLRSWLSVVHENAVESTLSIM
jgi:hypothetical protein